MANELVKWVPNAALPALPFSKIEVEYEGNQGALKLTCSIRSADGVTPWGQAQIRFSDVMSFKLYEEFQEPLQYEENLPWSDHVIEVPHGGIWPFFEIKKSDWLRRLATRDCREDLASRHMMVVSQNEAIHVATYHDSEVFVAVERASGT